MRFKKMINVILFTIVALVLCACSGVTLANPTSIPTQTLIPNTPTPFQPVLNNIYLSQGVPESWKTTVLSISGVNLIQNPDPSGLILSTNQPSNGSKIYQEYTRVYAIVVPFPTVKDEMSLSEIQQLWYGEPSGNNEFDALFISPDTNRLLTDAWGLSSSSFTKEIPAASIEQSVWNTQKSIAIVPFEEISPKYKVLKINGVSPLDKPMDMGNYPLSIHFYLSGNPAAESSRKETIKRISELIPLTNRDENKMTVLVMSGTTAMTRSTAYKIETMGIDYPIDLVKNWFLKADLRHVSNELAFVQDCPIPDPNEVKLIFCSSPRYIELLKHLGVNVVEVTGNHMNDYGAENFANTVKVYKDLGWVVFGGGVNSEEARQPVKLENNGNKIAFIGCNPAGPTSVWATETTAGAAKCDPDYYYSTIRSLKDQGYTVIATLQDFEVYVYMYGDYYKEDFRKAAEAGADIVQGSQAHFPMGFEIMGESLIHYGPGNFLFDQMDYPVVGTRREFIDRHVIYNGKYINTELLTALLTDWSRPVPMTITEREQFLTDLFSASRMR